ncbi:MAG: hypothetical protein J6L23_04330 [Clostridia bacterium]|nr:hypothetical protein [Clostridia bacterium]
MLLRTADAVLFKFVKFGRHKATAWLKMVAKPKHIVAVAFRGLNLFALQIGLDFGFAKNALHPRTFGKVRSKLLIVGDVTVSTSTTESFVNLFCRRQRRIP